MPKFIADFHIHSKFSMATSKNLTPDWLDFWARAKGIGLVGTGDFTHPTWVDTMEEQLQETGTGLFTLKNEFIHTDTWVENTQTHFMLTAEISSIYKKAGKTRKVHNILWAPSFEIARKVQDAFKKRNFNITSDGRPIIGFDSRDLLEMCLEVSEDIALVPAHIWTPWFSALGAKSGFDSIEECFEDLSHHIFAVETGLSSDTPMNWMISSLDKFALLSNSDAHSPEKLGRNANVFNCDLDYFEIIKALKERNGKTFEGTIDMFPQEGKYHYSGHRKCGVCLNPVEVLKNKFLCPKCKKPITLGVMDRVFQLSDKEDISACEKWQSTIYLIPLKEILSELYGVGPNTKTVSAAYKILIAGGGNEIALLCDMPLEKIQEFASPLFVEGIRRMRNKDVFISEGHDGEYGAVKVFTDKEIKAFKEDNNFVPRKYTRKNKSRFDFDLSEYQRLAKETDFSVISGKKPDSQLRLF